MNKRSKTIVAAAAVLALLAGTVFNGTPAAGAKAGASAKKATLKTKKITVKVGKTKKIALKNKNKKAKYTFKSTKKKIASVTKAGVVRGKKKGKAVIVVKEQTGKGKNKKIRKVGSVKVTVQAKAVNQPEATASTVPASSVAPSQTPGAAAQVSAAPTQTPANSTAVPAPTVTPEPTATPDPTPTPTPTIRPFDREHFDMPENYDWERDDTSIEYPEIQTIEYYSTTTEKDRKANIVLPVGYSEEKQYPVLYLLHGIGGDHTEWKGGNPQNILANLLADGEAKEMIIVMPNVRARANDAATTAMNVEVFQAFDNFINDLRDNLMPYMEEHYSIKTGRENTAVAGLSMGGREALYIGVSMPETFGYIGAFSPAVGVLPYTTEGGLFTEETFKLPDYFNGNTLLMICNGDSDSVVHDTPEQYHRVLEQNGTDHIYFTIEEGDHNFKVWKIGLYNFMKRIF